MTDCLLQAGAGQQPEEMTGGLACTKWEALSLVPDRTVEGLVTRKWDKATVRKPKMVIKKCEYRL